MGNRGLNTQHGIHGIETRCVGRQDKTNGKMKGGSKMARRLVTSTVERRPNKERDDFAGSSDNNERGPCIYMLTCRRICIVAVLSELPKLVNMVTSEDYIYLTNGS